MLLLSGFRLLMLLLCGFRLLLLRLLMLLLSGFRLLMLLLLLRFALLFLLLLALCVGRSNGSHQKEKNSLGDKSNCFHEYCLRYRDFLRPSLGAWGAPVVSGG
jgi:hypothetical protein